MKRMDLVEPGRLQRLLGKGPKENAFREVHNLLASAENPFAIAEEDITAIAERWKVDPRQAFETQVAESFRAFSLRMARKDGGASALPTDELQALAHRLGLKSDQTFEIVREVGRDVFRDLLTLTIRSQDFKHESGCPKLDRARNLGLTEQAAEEVYSEVRQQRLQSLLDSAVADERYSPNEQEQIEEEARRLGATTELLPGTREALDKMRLFWQIEEGKPPTINPGIHLQKNEVCYAVRAVSWHEHRTVTRRIRYGGPTARIRIMKGIYYRAGDVAVQRVSEDVLKLIDTGRLFLTDKRLLFMGARRNTSVRLNRVLDFTPYSNGIDIQKDSGKSPFIEFRHDVGLFAVYLDRALRDARS